LGHHSFSVLQDIARLLDDQDNANRWTSVKVLGRMAPEAIKYLPQIVRLLADSHTEVRLACLEAIILLSAEEVPSVHMEAVFNALEDKDVKVHLTLTLTPA